MSHTVPVWANFIAIGCLAKTMPLRKVSLGVDETFFADMLLVAMDVAAGFIISEKSSAALVQFNYSCK